MLITPTGSLRREASDGPGTSMVVANARFVLARPQEERPCVSFAIRLDKFLSERKTEWFHISVENNEAFLALKSSKS